MDSDTNPKREPKNVLVVGSWAKEQITIENLLRDPGVRAFAYMDTNNPAITELAHGYTIGELSDVKSIVDFADKQQIGLVMITTAEPLSVGLVDALVERGIRAFGPTRSAARLESDKAFTRKLMADTQPGSVPEFRVYDSPDDAVDWAKSHDWQVAVKPVGLTEGLGVRVHGDQLKDADEVTEYIRHICAERVGGSSNVIVEEKIAGEEFTLQALVHDETIVPVPAVQDFKKLLPGEKGPNTASMGSYSAAGWILPFMRQEHYDTALEVMRKTLRAFKEKTGDICTGFLYGQFMLTADGVKLVEYNFRPGDPEWINTLFVLKSSLLEVVEAVLAGHPSSPSFEPLATVCKYIVPKEYPAKLYQTLDVTFKPEEIEKLGVGAYYSAGVDEQSKLNVGSERGIAFIAKSDAIPRANELVDKAISRVQGEFYYRRDIGTQELIDSKIAHVWEL